MKRVIFSSVAMMAMSACALPPSQYSAEPVSGQVVDARTNAPLAGVAVVAQWELQGGLEGHSYDLLHVEEAVTDADGRYHVSGWGPVARPMKGHLDIRDPSIIFFKSGYAIRSVSNVDFYAPDERSSLEVRTSGWNGMTIKLDPSERQGRNPPGIEFTWLLYGLRAGSSPCWWKKTPNFVRAIDAEFEAIRRVNGPMISDSHTLARLTQRKQCAPFDEFTKNGGLTK